ncbi:MAG: hypothetical protein LBS88_03390 [Tannerellaceae bacterium]|jgi:hypothetical protein|nr:hypothetical protein [Tannerellaceae bacterium]
MPYTNRVRWSDKKEDSMNILLNTIIPVLNEDSIVAVSRNKKQKTNNSEFKRIDKHKTGYRIIE